MSKQTPETPNFSVANWIATLGISISLLTAINIIAGDEIKKCVFSPDKSSCASNEIFAVSIAAIFAVITFSSLIVIFVLVFKWISKRFFSKAKTTPRRRDIDINPLPLGENPEPIQICELLYKSITNNKEIIQNYDLHESEVYQIVSDLRSGILRIYFFGHQNAGKSSLINSLLGQSVSPSFSEKLTACPVRIRWGEKALFVENYGNDNTHVRRKIADLKREMKEWSTLAIEQRPLEVVIEIPHPFLKEQNIELIDSPGTGSAWHEHYKSSLEDEIVNSKLKSAAIVIIVYKLSQTQTEAHERLVREMGDNNVPTIAICNLCPDWVNRIKKDRGKTHLDIKNAEQFLKNRAKATCFKTVAEYSERNYEGFSERKELARREKAESIDDLRAYIVELLKNRKKYVVNQAILESRIRVDNLLQQTNNQINDYQPVFDRIMAEQRTISQAITSFRFLFKKGYQAKNGTENIGVGATAGTLGMAALATLATGGTALIPVLACGAIGLLGGAAGGAYANKIEDEKRQTQFRNQIAQSWANLQNILRDAKEIDIEKILTSNTLQSVQTSATFIKEQEWLPTISKLENEIDTGLDKINGYSIYSRNRKFAEQLRILRGYFHRAYRQ